MSADSALTAVAVLRALLAEDTECLAVLLPDGIPGHVPPRGHELAMADSHGACPEQGFLSLM